MAVRGEEVASSIDAQVREAVERMVGEIRSSIEDIRAAVDSQLKAALQSVQADVNATSFLPQIQKAVTELEESFAADQPPVAAAPPAAAGVEAGKVKRAIQNVERGKSQVDILNALLEQCLEFGSRAALLILRGETFSGWKGVGFSAHGGNDEMIKRFNAAPGLIPELDRVLRDEKVVSWDGANLSSRFGVGASARALLVPMVIKDKVAAAVYVDVIENEDGRFDQASIELLVFATGLLIDTLAIRKKSPSPSLSEDGEAAAAPAAQPARAAAPPPPAPAPAPTPAPTPAPAAPAGGETVAISAAQIREMMANTPAPAAAPAKPAFNLPTATTFDSTTAAPAPKVAPPPPPPPPPAAPPASSFGGDEGRPSTQFVPPAGLTGRAGMLAAQSENEKKHEEARRFARLLVSEIKLYNEAKVEVGRKNHDLYERLKEDIDRSRQMYDERIGEDVRTQSNYFYDELVRILADGRADALGL
jgi:enamine deaminase RidA (YjgF/YER057c/UK114 family)